MTSLEDELANPDLVQEVADLRRSLTNTQIQLKRAKAKSDDLVAAAIEASKDATLALGSIRPTEPPRLKPTAKGLSEEVALPDSGDWQFSKVTTSYNSEVATRRVMQFAHKSIALTERTRATAWVPSATLIFGGDMIEGLFNFPSQPFEIDATLFEQFVKASRLLVDYVRLYLANFDHVTVVPEWGNHGRIGSKRDAVPRADNVDRMCFELAKQLLENEERLTWQDCPEDVQRLEIGNYRALVMHGDEVGRNGFASPTTLVQHMNRWKSGAYRVDGKPWHFRDVYIHHFHTHNEWALADGEGSLFQTGSTESDNRYAGIGMASTALPTQRLHFIDPDEGRVTTQHKVWLD